MSGLQLLARKTRFSCIHKYEVDGWDEESNKEVFGACYSKHGHGHNYVLEAWYSGPVDPETGMIVNLRGVDEMIQSAVSPLDGTFLNSDVEFFKDKVPTTENLLMYLKERLLAALGERLPKRSENTKLK